MSSRLKTKNVVGVVQDLEEDEYIKQKIKKEEANLLPNLTVSKSFLNKKREQTESNLNLVKINLPTIEMLKLTDKKDILYCLKDSIENHFKIEISFNLDYSFDSNLVKLKQLDKNFRKFNEIMGNIIVLFDGKQTLENITKYIKFKIFDDSEYDFNFKSILLKKNSYIKRNFSCFNICIPHLDSIDNINSLYNSACDKNGDFYFDLQQVKDFEKISIKDLNYLSNGICYSEHTNSIKFCNVVNEYVEKIVNEIYGNEFSSGSYLSSLTSNDIKQDRIVYLEYILSS